MQAFGTLFEILLPSSSRLHGYVICSPVQSLCNELNISSFNVMSIFLHLTFRSQTNSYNEKYRIDILIIEKVVILASRFPVIAALT